MSAPSGPWLHSAAVLAFHFASRVSNVSLFLWCDLLRMCCFTGLFGSCGCASVWVDAGVGNHAIRIFSHILAFFWHIFQGLPVVFCVEGWSMVKVQLGLGRRAVTCLCVMRHRFLCCVIFFCFNMESPDSPTHEDYLSTSSNEVKNRNRVKRGKGQGGGKAHYCTRTTPQQQGEFPHEPLAVKLTDSGEEGLWCLCCGKPVAQTRHTRCPNHVPTALTPRRGPWNSNRGQEASRRPALSEGSTAPEPPPP